MPNQTPIDAQLAARNSVLAHSVALSTKADCGCGCGGAETKEEDTVPPLGYRHVIPAPLTGNQEAVEAKTAAHLSDIGEPLLRHRLTDLLEPGFAVKVGMVGSHSRVDQAVQSVVSYAVPGDMSRVRSPIRSAAYRAITPGGGDNNRGLLRAIGRTASEEALRCPPGYEGGGRFARRDLSNCGARLFALATGPDGADLLGGARAALNTGTRGSLRDILAGRYGDSPIISRAAQVADVPPLGRGDKQKFESAIETSLAAASSGKPGFARIVRRDGVVLTPVAKIEKLSKQRKNPEMVGSAYIVSVTSPNNIGGDELSLLGAGISQIHYALPGNISFVLRARNDITPRRASALRRKLGSIRASGDEDMRALNELVRESNGDLSLSSRFPHIDDPTEMVVMERKGIRRSVQRWAYLTWYAPTAPGRPKTSAGWRIVDGAKTDT